MKVIRKIFILILCASAFVGCTKNIPDNLDALGDDVNYTTREFNPTLGRNEVWENAINVGMSSTLPLSFKLINPRTAEGEPATELTDKFPVNVWIKQYTGEEKSLEEIEEKRKMEYRPIFEIGEKSGHPMFWNAGNSAWIKTSPDLGYLFDVEISNSGGRKYARDLELKPYRERPYEPSIYDPTSGIATNSHTYPSLMMNLYGDRTGNVIFPNEIEVYFHKDETNTKPGNTLTFSMVDSLNNYFDIQQFKDTDWDNLIHGFNPVFEDNKVIYEVAYPMPLIEYPTRYTNADGTRAGALFRYNRIGYGGMVSEAGLGLDFAIYEEGHWEIQFRFRGESPKFEDE